MLKITYKLGLIIIFSSKNSRCLINSCPAIRYNLICRTPAYKDFHFYRGYETTFCFLDIIQKRKNCNNRT